MMSTFFFPDARYLAPWLMPVAVFAGRRTEQVIAGGTRRLRALVVGLLALHCLGVPGSGSIAEVPTLLTAPPTHPSVPAELLQALRQHEPGLVLCSVHPVLSMVVHDQKTCRFQPTSQRTRSTSTQ